MSKEMEYAEILWDYLCVGENIGKADCIIVCGGHDSNVINCAIDLFNKNYAEYIVVSGGLKRKVFGIDDEKIEAEILADLLYKSGIPSDKIYLEKESKNTTENFVLSDQLMTSNGFNFDKYIMIQKPYVKKRTMATLKKVVVNKEVVVVSESTSFSHYINSEIPFDKIVNMLVGEIQRLIEYPHIGWTVKVDIPSDVLEAYNELINLGYTERMFSNETLKKFKEDSNYVEVK